MDAADSRNHRSAVRGNGVLLAAGDAERAGAEARPRADRAVEAGRPGEERRQVAVDGEVPRAEAAEFGRLAARLAGEDAVHLLELNLSCPNVEHRGEVFATDPATAAEVVRTVKAAAGQPVLAKLTADVADLVAVARAVVDAGADGLTLINTLLGMAVDVHRRRPKLAAVTGGLSGPAIRPVAVRCIWQVATALPGVPIVGTGGVATAEDAAELLLVGATAVAVGTASELWSFDVLEREEPAPPG